MSRRLLGGLLILCGLIAFHLSRGVTPTPTLWSATYDKEILFQPCQLGGQVAVLGGRKEIALFSSKGELVSRAELPREPRYPPIRLDSAVVVVDRQAGVRAYGEGQLKLLWERALVVPPRLPPLPLPGNRLLLATTRAVLFAVDGATGEPAWQADFSGEVVRVAVGSSVACVFGYTDVLRPTWKLRAIDLELGQELWTFPEPILEQAPVAFKDMFIFVNAKGSPIGVDQETGEVRFRLPGEGYRVLHADGDYLLLLAQGGTRFDCYSLTGKNSWSTTLPAQFVSAVIAGDRILLADRQFLRCVEAGTGKLLWQKDLGPILLAYPHRQGMAVLFKQTFIDRQTLFAYYPASEGKPDWICTAGAMFHAPIPFGGTDFVACRSGSLYGVGIESGSKAPADGRLPFPIPGSGSATFWNGTTGLPGPSPTEKPAGNGSESGPAPLPQPTMTGSATPVRWE